MTQLLLLLLSVFFVCTSFKQSNNRSNNDHGDDQLPVYNDILNELVESHFCNRYLGKDAEGFLSKYVNNPADSLNTL